MEASLASSGKQKLELETLVAAKQSEVNEKESELEKWNAKHAEIEEERTRLLEEKRVSEEKADRMESEVKAANQQLEASLESQQKMVRGNYSFSALLF